MLNPIRPLWEIPRVRCGSPDVPQPGTPRITVLVVTYNHEAYIRQAIESVLMQRLSEPYQILVADDASSDGTRQIIKEPRQEYTNALVSVHEIEHAEQKPGTAPFLSVKNVTAAYGRSHIKVLWSNYKAAVY